MKKREPKITLYIHSSTDEVECCVIDQNDLESTIQTLESKPVVIVCDPLLRINTYYHYGKIIKQHKVS